MADTTDFLAEWTSGGLLDGEFTPYAQYGCEEDALIVFFRADPYYRKRLNTRATVYVSETDGELVGFQIKSIRHVLEDIEWQNMTIRHGKVRVDLLFLALRGEFACEPESRILYRKIGEQVSRAGLEDDVNQSAC